MHNEALVRRIAASRIATLLYLAEIRTLEKTESARKLAKRYVGIARRISSHYKVPFPDSLKFKTCKNCDNFLVPGINCRVVVASVHGYVAYVCECGRETHVPYIRKRAEPAKRASRRSFGGPR